MGFRTKEERNAYERGWRARNRDKVREQKRRSREKHKERRNAWNREQRAEAAKKRKAHQKAWREKNPEVYRMSVIRRTLRAKAQSLASSFKVAYNITLEQFRTVNELQGGGCAICGVTESVGRSKRLNVDHDHVTGIVRGLLCTRCNSAIGYMGDNPEFLKRAALYLEGFRAETNNPDWVGRVRSVLGRLSKKGSKERSHESMAEAQPKLGLASGDTDCFGLAVPAGELVEGWLSVRAKRRDVSEGGALV